MGVTVRGDSGGTSEQPGEPISDRSCWEGPDASVQARRSPVRGVPCPRLSTAATCSTLRCPAPAPPGAVGLPGGCGGVAAGGAQAKEEEEEAGGGRRQQQQLSGGASPA